MKRSLKLKGRQESWRLSDTEAPVSPPVQSVSHDDRMIRCETVPDIQSAKAKALLVDLEQHSDSFTLEENTKVILQTTKSVKNILAL